MGRVLIVDDEADTAEVTAQYLRQAGHQVRSVPNGREALASLSEQIPDVAILDVRMPEMDGITFLEVMRCYLRWETVPVILITGFPDDSRLSRAHKLGIRRVFTKGDFKLADLLVCVNENLADPKTEAQTLAQARSRQA
ncbi:MAG TPA: response regulator [Tepidisphaeraceae bacterium]|nr:response regulator [Tepidisphaeraceae bacterium]